MSDVTDTSPAAVEVMAQYYSGWARDIRVQGIHSADAEYRDETANTLRALSAERDAAVARAEAAETRVINISAGLFPGGYDRNIAVIRAALSIQGAEL